MIPKITRGSDFGALVHYLVDHRDHDVIELRGVSSIDMAACEMAIVAKESRKATSVVLHLSLSAAHQDGVLSSAQWKIAVDAHEAELGLHGRQRVIVRHSDKEHDHVHVFWCTISLETGRPPAKQWFLKKGVAKPGSGISALSETSLEHVPESQRRLGSYDKFALLRAQNVCRRLEKALELRQLRSPCAVAEARIAGEGRPSTVRQKLREDRTGCESLLARADAIRAALSATDWPSAHYNLARLGLGLEPVFRSTKANGQELRGLMIYDLADVGNRLPASALDSPNAKFGLRQLEKRHSPEASTMEQWWPSRSDVSFVPAKSRPVSDAILREQYAAARAAHSAAERQLSQERRRLQAAYQARRKSTSARLKRIRKWLAMRMATSKRRAFYRAFSIAVRTPRMALTDAERASAAHNKRRRFSTWTEFVAKHGGEGRSTGTLPKEPGSDIGIAPALPETALRARSTRQYVGQEVPQARPSSDLGQVDKAIAAYAATAADLVLRTFAAGKARGR